MLIKEYSSSTCEPSSYALHAYVCFVICPMISLYRSYDGMLARVTLLPRLWSDVQLGCRHALTSTMDCKALYGNMSCKGICDSASMVLGLFHRRSILLYPTGLVEVGGRW